MITRNRTRNRILWAPLVWGTFGLGLCACGSSPTPSQGSPRPQNFAAESRRIFDPIPEAGAAPVRVVEGSAIPDAPTRGLWSIVLNNFADTPSGRLAATNALEQARSTGQLPDVYLERRGDRIVLAIGRYERIDDPAARAALERIQGMVVGIERPYARALLTPPPVPEVFGTMPEYDLRHAKERHRPDALYTLQIGIYGRLDRSDPSPSELAEYRRAAEKAAVDLRRQGEPAFYYHAPTRSMVTVGLFTQRDHDPGLAKGDSFELRRMRDRHPYNLHNGTGLKESVATRSGGRADRLQPSMLVAVP